MNRKKRLIERLGDMIISFSFILASQLFFIFFSTDSPVESSLMFQIGKIENTSEG